MALLAWASCSQDILTGDWCFYFRDVSVNVRVDVTVYVPGRLSYGVAGWGIFVCVYVWVGAHVADGHRYLQISMLARKSTYIPPAPRMSLEEISPRVLVALRVLVATITTTLVRA